MIRKWTQTVATAAILSFFLIGMTSITGYGQETPKHKKPKKAKKQVVVEPASYRILRNGEYFQIDAKGVELLKAGIQSGYETGYGEAKLDKTYGRTGGFNASTKYQDGTMGWQDGVDRDLYKYYFQQGFERGYSDGYSGQSRFGHSNGNTYVILGPVLNAILGIKSY
jgi:hypothetical protein